LDKEKAIRYLSKFDDAVRMAGEFYAEEGVDVKNGAVMQESYLISFIEQNKETKKEK
jgi:hypothetical protein